MNIHATQVLEKQEPGARRATRLKVADCDLHPVPNSTKDLYPFMEKRWQAHFESFGARRRQGIFQGPAYPKGQPEAARRDAWPPGGRPGSSLEFMQKQHLDPNGVELGVLTVINPHPGNYQNAEQSIAMCRAVNDWQIAEWTSKDRRLKGSILAAYEHGTAAVAEIERLAGDPNFVQVFLLSRTAQPLGNRGYWPIYEAASKAGLPVGIHAFGNSGFPFTSSGWPSYYVEEMTGHAQSCQAQVTSLVIEGVFEKFPGLRVVFIESGFAWLPSLAWRLDVHWRKLKAENPMLKRLPSEYIRDHVFVTTQPMEEPERPRHLLDLIDWIGWDRVLYASDYPHWDFDDPAQVLPGGATDEQRRKLFLENALALYKVSQAA
jgi:predicted TIM-barrel fold metal-dependent hydrolase